MSTSRPSALRPPGGTAETSSSSEKSLFEQQREGLIAAITQSLEQVLHNLNQVNRNLESITAVGNEFGSVEALWSQFEGVMAKDTDTAVEYDDGQGPSQTTHGDADDGGDNEVSPDERQATVTATAARTAGS